MKKIFIVLLSGEICVRIKEIFYGEDFPDMLLTARGRDVIIYQIIALA